VRDVLDDVDPWPILKSPPEQATGAPGPSRREPSPGGWRIRTAGGIRSCRRRRKLDENVRTRGWWIDSRDLLRTSREAEAAGLEILGSIHMHPDWHRIGPPKERQFVLSERPTPMDQHVFANTGWPINVVCYLERRGDAIYHALAAWTPPHDPTGQCTALPLRVRTHAPADA